MGEVHFTNQMGQAGLMMKAVFLRGGISVRYPNRWLMPVHHCTDDLARAGIVGLMNDGAVTAKHPVKGVCALYPDTGLVASNDIGLASC